MTLPVPTDFECVRCGNCCTIKGAVTVSQTEIERMAGHLGISARDFADCYTELKPSRAGLKLKDHEDGSCIFLNRDRSCRVNPVKPDQCSGFPHDWNYEEWTKVCAFNYRARETKEELNEA